MQSVTRDLRAILAEAAAATVSATREAEARLATEGAESVDPVEVEHALATIPDRAAACRAVYPRAGTFGLVPFDAPSALAAAVAEALSVVDPKLVAHGPVVNRGACPYQDETGGEFRLLVSYDALLDVTDATATGRSAWIKAADLAWKARVGGDAVVLSVGGDKLDFRGPALGFNVDPITGFALPEWWKRPVDEVVGEMADMLTAAAGRLGLPAWGMAELRAAWKARAGEDATVEDRGGVWRGDSFRAVPQLSFGAPARVFNADIDWVDAIKLTVPEVVAKIAATLGTPAVEVTDVEPLTIETEAEAISAFGEGNELAGAASIVMSVPEEAGAARVVVDEKVVATIQPRGKKARQ